MRILAIDPGSAQSAFVVYDVTHSKPDRYSHIDYERAGIKPNEKLLDHLNKLSSWGIHHLAIEMPVARGMPASNQLFATCVWIGRFIERWKGTHEFVDRAKVKLHVCHDSRATDTNIRAALIDRWGGKEQAVGRVASRGPLYGFKKDMWSALAVAVTAAEK